MEEKKENLISRPPVVVVLGHVDSGKTSILLAIRKMEVTGEKPGGIITQHIGAYQVEVAGKKITFLDTPGHEAFSQMRSRGARVADIAVLVVDAIAGIQAQTREAISHIKKAQIPFCVALNKVDKPEANPVKVMQELQKEGVLVESLGGKVPQVLTSARTGKGINELLELIILLAEMENLQADLSRPGQGVVIESYLDSRRGPTATLILNQGILKPGDIISTPSTFGKVKILEDFQANPVEKILPGDPAIVIGFEEVPRIGENFQVFFDIESAKKYLTSKETKESIEVLEIGPEQRILNLILKTDVRGSIEAIKEILTGLPQEKVILRILKAEVGEVSESDIKLARSAKATVLGFRVKTHPVAKQLAEKEKIKIITFEVIYDLVQGVRNLMEKIAAPEIKREELGRVRVLTVFLTDKNRQIIGGKVTEGEARKGAKIEVFRKEELLGKGKLVNLQRNKKDIAKLGKGEECGILYEGETKIETGDVLVVYTEEKQRTEL